MFIWKTVSELEHYPDWIRLFMMRPGHVFRHEVTRTSVNGDLLFYPYGAYDPDALHSGILAVQKALMKRYG